jgi:hypothetical protein
MGAGTGGKAEWQAQQTKGEGKQAWGNLEEAGRKARVALG